MDTTKICVDTDIVIDYLRGKNKNQEILPELIAKHNVYISHFNKVRGLKVIDGTKYLR